MGISLYRHDKNGETEILNCGYGGWCDIKLTIASMCGFFKRSEKSMYSLSTDTIKLRTKLYGLSMDESDKISLGLYRLFEAGDTDVEWDEWESYNVGISMKAVLKKHRRDVLEHTQVWNDTEEQRPSSFFWELAHQFTLGGTIRGD